MRSFRAGVSTLIWKSYQTISSKCPRFFDRQWTNRLWMQKHTLGTNGTSDSAFSGSNVNWFWDRWFRDSSSETQQLCVNDSYLSMTQFEDLLSRHKQKLSSVLTQWGENVKLWILISPATLASFFFLLQDMHQNAFSLHVPLVYFLCMGKSWIQICHWCFVL